MDFSDSTLYTKTFKDKNKRYGFTLFQKLAVRNGLPNSVEVASSRSIYSTQIGAEEAGTRYLARQRQKQGGKLVNAQ